MGHETIVPGSSIPETIEIDEHAEEYFGFKRPQNVLIVEGETDKIALENYQYHSNCQLSFEVRTAEDMGVSDYSGKDNAISYYKKNRDNQNICLLLDRDYDYIANSNEDDTNIFYYDFFELENYAFEENVLKNIFLVKQVEPRNIENIINFLKEQNDNLLSIINSLMYCSKLRIFRKLHREEKTSLKLSQIEIRELSAFLKKIDIKSCIICKKPEYRDKNFIENLDLHLKENVNRVKGNLYNDIFNEVKIVQIKNPETLIKFLQYYYKGKDVIQFFSSILTSENMLKREIQITSNEIVSAYVPMFSQLYKEKIEEINDSYKSTVA